MPKLFTRFDGIGFILLVVILLGIQTFVNMGDDFEWLVSPFLTGVLVTVLVALPCFIIWEMAERHPALDIRLFGHRNFTIGIICSMLGELQTSYAAPTPQPTAKAKIAGKV
jgi:DHA2 family multidrug resistance protein